MGIYYLMQNDNVNALCYDIYNCNWIESAENEGHKMMSNFDAEIVIYQSEDGEYYIRWIRSNM